MEIKRYRVVAIGANTPNVLSEISQSLSLHNYEIETISSLRLGHSIVVICLVEATQNKNVIKNCLKSIVDKYDMKLIVDQTSRDKYKFIKSDAFLRIRGHHEAGIKAYVISELIDAGFDIHGLESETYEVNKKQQFVMNIKGEAKKGLERLSVSANKLNNQGLDTAFATDWNLLV